MKFRIWSILRSWRRHKFPVILRQRFAHEKKPSFSTSFNALSSMKSDAFLPASSTTVALKIVNVQIHASFQRTGIVGFAAEEIVAFVVGIEKLLIVFIHVFSNDAIKKLPIFPARLDGITERLEHRFHLMGPGAQEFAGGNKITP